MKLAIQVLGRRSRHGGPWNFVTRLIHAILRGMSKFPILVAWLSLLYFAPLDAFAQALPSTVNILKNPGFENGATDWSSSQRVPVFINDPARSHSGGWYVRLGGQANTADLVAQSVTIPANTSRADLHFWIRTSEANQDLNLIIADSRTGRQLMSTMVPSTRSWTEALVDLSPFKGQQIKLLFVGYLPAFIAPGEFDLDDLTVLIDAPDNHTGLWWNPSESGWGVNFAHQGDTLFATLFVYDTDGSPMWLVMSNGRRPPNDETFLGQLYRTTGPAFNAQPFTAIGSANLTSVGTMTVAFAGGNGTLTYSVNGVTIQKTIQKQIFGSRASTCVGTTDDRAGSSNYQDLWWNPSESGWGVNISQQDNVLFATLFSYRNDGLAANKGMWLVMSAGNRQSDGSFAGDLFEVHGSPFNANPFIPIGPANVNRVGSMQLRFDSGTRGTISYTVNGVSVVKSIQRQEFASPTVACN
jgi:hypothetical protein